MIKAEHLPLIFTACLSITAMTIAMAVMSSAGIDMNAFWSNGDLSIGQQDWITLTISLSLLIIIIFIIRRLMRDFDNLHTNIKQKSYDTHIASDKRNITNDTPKYRKRYMKNH